jgi:hypothetical protein
VYSELEREVTGKVFIRSVKMIASKLYFRSEIGCCVSITSLLKVSILM